MKLIRKNSRTDGSVHVAAPCDAIGRRTFLRRSGLTMGGAAVATMLPPTMMRKASAAAGHGPRKAWRPRCGAASVPTARSAAA